MITCGRPVNPLAALYPISHIGMGEMVIVTAPLGPPLHVDSKTYKGNIFIAPCDGCRIVDIWIAAAVKNSAATNTFDISNYDASADTARAVITQLDPDTITTALEGFHLTLTTTKAYLDMDEGDVLNYTMVIGTPCTNGEGHSLTAVIWVPYPAKLF
jgi:hypothetical protein